MKILNIQNYQDYKSYFRDFLLENKTFDPKFSHRSFAKRLNWPVSLVNDVISERKSLTLSRCLEFCTFATFSEEQTRYFLFLCLMNHPNERLRNFVERDLLQAEVPDSHAIRHRGVVTLNQKFRQEIEQRIIELVERLNEMERESRYLPYENNLKYKFDINIFRESIKELQ
jgi:hypothetical protein